MVYAWAMVGALGPEIIRWRKISQSRMPGEWKRPSYWIATVFYCGLAVALADLTARPQPYAAFLSGLTTELSVLGLLAAAKSPPALPETANIEEVSSTDENGLSGRARLVLRVLSEHAAFLHRN
jgi:hypothetical protein